MTTFNLPDLRGRFLRGVNHGSGNDQDTGSRFTLYSGGNNGDRVGSYQEDAFQGHWHKAGFDSSPGNGSTGLNSGHAYDDTPETLDIKYESMLAYDIVTDGVNGDPRISSETRPKNVYVNYIIKH